MTEFNCKHFGSCIVCATFQCNSSCPYYDDEIMYDEDIEFIKDLSKKVTENDSKNN